MPEDNSKPELTPPSAPIPPKPGPRPVARQKKIAQPIDPAHVPMTEEFDKAKWTLPPWQPVVVALGIVAVIAALVSYTFRYKPVAAGGIDNVVAVQIPPGDSVLVAINVTVANTSQRPLWVHFLKAQLKTDKGDFSDEAASAVDFERYFQAFPELKQGAIAPLLPEAKIASGASQSGTIIVSFPVSRQAFDQRKAISVIVEPYDQRPVVLSK